MRLLLVLFWSVERLASQSLRHVAYPDVDNSGIVSESVHRAAIKGALVASLVHLLAPASLLWILRIDTTLEIVVGVVTSDRHERV